MASTGFIRIEGARQNNLQNLTFDLPLGIFHVLTGPSGSGKSSLAFDTLYAEGQRRYAETFSPYTRQFLERMDRPRVDRIEGIPPAIALGQANPVRSSRSTVGTVTEISDYVKLLFPRIAELSCPDCSQSIRPWTPHSILQDLFKNFSGQEAWFLFRVPFPKKTPADEAAAFIARQGFRRALLDGLPVRLDEREGLERFAQALRHSPEEKLLLPVIQDRILLSPANRTRLSEALTACLRFGQGTAAISLAEKPAKLHLYSSRYHCARDQRDFHEPTPALFSFNHPVGACPLCRGFGRVVEIDDQLALPDRSLSIAAGVVKPWQTESFEDCQRDLEKACRRHHIPLDVPFSRLTAGQQKFVVEGEGGASRELQELWDSGDWYGVRGFFRWLETKTYKMHVRILLARYRTYRPCPDCGGRRYQPQTGFWRMAGKTLPEINALPFTELAAFFEKIKTRDESALMPLENIRKRLRFLLGVGLGYLTLDRATRTLSGGELQRVNLTGCLGTGLTGTLFVLDEPSIGLHPRDTGRLLGLLHELRQSGNTVLVVEHDESVIRAAESILELGPGSGAAGGRLLYSGAPAGLLKVKESPTGAYLSGRKSIPVPTERRPCPEKNHPWLKIRGATRHNLKNLDFAFPLRRLVAVSGVSGSGKSTLVHEIVHQALLQHLGRPVEEAPKLKSMEGAEEISDVVLVDQSPLSQTPRSTPLLYLDIYDAVRELFASTEEAQSAGLAASAFSFNAGGGRCERCGGMGYEKVTMQFLSDVFVSCPSCEGRRFQSHVLAARYLGKTIDQLLEMTAAEALDFFGSAEDLPPRARECHQKIRDSLKLLTEVGLGYLRCGQPLSQLSGGEAQRLKLIAHLTQATRESEKPARGGRRKKRPTGSPLLILDEPTTGLHLDDVRLLVSLLHRLVEQGNSLLVIEHHLDVLKSSDWLLDLGPEAGQEGGRLVASGTPETVAACRGSHTASFLAPLLRNSRPARLPEIPAAPQNGHAAPSEITVRGARHHNLKNLNVSIPRDKMVVVTGLSGSGKSTLAFDLLFSEGQRRYLDCLNTYARQFVEQMEKPDVDSITGLPPSVAIEQRTTRGGRKSTVATVTELYQFLRLLYAKLGVQHDPDTGEPAIRQTSADIVKRIRTQLRSAKNLSLLAPLIRGRKGFHTEVARWAQKKGFSLLRVDGKWIEPAKFQPLDRYKEHQIDVLVAQVGTGRKDLPAVVSQTLALGKGTLYAVDHRGKSTIHSHHLFCPGTNRSFDELDPRLFSFNSPHGWCPECQGYGTVFAEPPEPKSEDEAEKEQEMELAREELEEEEEDQLLPCPSCQGARLHPVARAVRFAGRPVPQINRMSVREFGDFFSDLRFSGREAAIVRDIRPEIEQRLHFLRHVGLDYLNLDRSAPTLSGGESQRIRLAAQLGSNLQGVLYVLDEPTIGLHPRDNEKLLGILQNLRDRGNSLVVVEHDEDTMRAADHILDLGPGAGVHGGEIVAQGTWKQIAKNDTSATARLLGSPIRHPSRGQRRPVKNSDSWLTIRGACIRTIQNLNLEIPLYRLIAFSGVSGSGKSTLLHEILLPAAGKKKKKAGQWKSVTGADSIDRVVEVDQSPIGKTPRSTVATYLGLMDELRALYAALPEAKQAGFTASHFSHNAGPGRCPACDGAGTVRIQMNFLPPADVRCEECNGHRWKQEILSIRYRDKSIHDALHLSAEQAAEFFSAQPRLATPCRLLTETGLGYLQLGQTSPTLSGGEAQRLKLVTELAAAQISADQAQAKGRARRPAHHLFLLEEPTVGLHLADVRRLIDLLHRLVDTGHTVVVIEHHLDVLAEADYLVDLGPESGEAGGKIVAQGTPEQVASSPTSRTAPFLRSHLNRSAAPVGSARLAV